MIHRARKRIFGREKKVRVALMRSLASALIEREKITTTEAKAKELRPFVEKLVTKSRTPTVAARRLIASRLASVAGADKLVSTIAPRYKERAGGYTRITKLPSRGGDASPMAVIEFV